MMLVKKMHSKEMKMLLIVNMATSGDVLSVYPHSGYITNTGKEIVQTGYRRRDQDQTVRSS